MKDDAAGKTSDTRHGTSTNWNRLRGCRRAASEERHRVASLRQPSSSCKPAASTQRQIQPMVFQGAGPPRPPPIR
jgi:hypothetical protein